MRMIHYCVMALVAVFLSVSPLTSFQAKAEVVIRPTNLKPLKLTDEAIDNIKTLKRVLTELNLTQHYSTLLGIMLVETRAGMGGTIGLPRAHWTRRSYGLMQLTLPTARDMFFRYPAVAEKYFPAGDNKRLIKALIENKELNIVLGAMLFDLYHDMTHEAWGRTVAAYNMGIGNALKRPGAPGVKYVKDTKMMMKNYVPLIDEHLASLTVEPPTENVDSISHDETIVNKEKNNGEEPKASSEGPTEAQHPERPTGTQEVQDNTSNDHTAHANDRGPEGSDQGNR